MPDTISPPTTTEILTLADRASYPARYEAARKHLAECHRVDEAKDIADKMAALAVYAKQANDEELENLVRRIKGRAVLRMGQILKSIKKASGGDRSKNAPKGNFDQPTRRQVATEAGLSPKQERNAKSVATLHEEHPERAEAMLESGASVSAMAEVWPDLNWTGSVRVLGVDTPEIAGECDREKRWAIASRNYVRNLLIDETVYLTGIENDKYGGRVLAYLFLEDGRSLTDLLIEGNYGRAYDGGERGDWCDESLVMPSDVPLTTDESSDDESEDPYDDPNHPLTLYDDNRNGRISCAEARAHGIAPVYSTHPAYPYMTDADGDGVVCE